MADAAAQHAQDPASSKHDSLASSSRSASAATSSPQTVMHPPITALDLQGTTELARRISRGQGSNFDGSPAESDSNDHSAKASGNNTHDPFSSSAKFDLGLYLRHLLAQGREQGIESRAMGVGWTDLTVTGTGSGFGLQPTTGSLFTDPILGLPTMIRSLRNPPVKHILQDLEGFVRPGEMCLVLGRPGSGCTTFLKTIANYRDGYRSIEGEVLYEGFDHKIIEGLLRGDVVYAPEDDIHFATLNVAQTLEFAAATRAPQAKLRMDLEKVGASRKSYISLLKEVLGTILGLRHTFNTLVGNELIRGVSGGEKKRVSIAETLASRAKITCFDNSSRGLDSSTALEFIQALRLATDISDLTMLCSLYQAGEHMVRAFDKVMVLNEGRMIYFGPLVEAHQHFHEMGFRPHEHQTTADFLVSCTDVHGRRVREGFENKVPSTAAEQAAYFKNSPAGRRNAEATAAYFAEMRQNHQSSGFSSKYKTLARAEHAKHVPKSSKFVLSPFQQIRLCMQRRAQILWGDRLTTIIMSAAALFQALIIGSTFYQMPRSTIGFFSRGGVLFFLLLYQSFMAIGEIQNSYAQRPIVIRQKRFAMCSPSADALANVLLDIPVRMITITVFLLIMYFMTGLAYTGGQFFVCYGIVCLTTFVMVSTFRALAALFRGEPVATLLSGLIVIGASLYTGYVIPRPSMVVWWRWISYAQPLAYAFELLIANEFRNLEVPCAQLVPSGPGYENVALANQVCVVAGSQPGVDVISGSEYILASFGYTWDNRGRNAGILIAFFIFSVAVYALATEYQTDPSASGGVMIFRRNAAPKAVLEAVKNNQAGPEDIEAAQEKGGPTAGVAGSSAIAHSQSAAVGKIEVAAEVFSWHNINYDVLIKGSPRRLLSNVSGYVQPGKLTALMGESGAGKTTLLNILAQRAGTGIVGGDFYVSGQSLPKSFQAATGYCQQQDVHMNTASVREALRFSALLRQPAEVPLQEKYDYVEEVITMLEMESWAEAVVGDVGGMGLSVEQRKRLTIGVELAAKPKLLLFLDEPTSGLDAQAAWSIVRFLRKLADHGQAILCTIHQPSGELFSVFDRLLLLQKGGKTVFFGDTGKACDKVINYFETRSGRKCSEEDNPAEFILEVIGAGATATSEQDWHQLFLESELQSELDTELHEILHGDAAGSGLSPEDEARGNREYAASLATQFWQVTKRNWVHNYRSPVYMGAKIGLSVVSGLFIGSSFWKQGSLVTTAALQNKLFAVFMALVLCTTLSQQMQPHFISLRDLFEAREKPSKMYQWYMVPIAFLITEIPWDFLAGVTFWLPWYFLIDFSPGDHGRAALSWLYLGVFFQIYWSTFALAVAALAPNALLASILFSTSFSFVIVYAGVVQPLYLMPTFWKAWLPLISPFTYLLEGLLGNTLGDEQVRCAASELNTLIPPTGQTCATYLANFSSNLTSPAFGTGYYITNDDGTCGFCIYRSGQSYLTSLSGGPVKMSADHRFRNVWILAIFCLFNLILCFATFWIFRIKVWGGKGGKKAANKKSKVAATTAEATEVAEEKMTAAAGTSQGVTIPSERNHSTTRGAGPIPPPTTGIVPPGGTGAAGLPTSSH